MHRQRVLPSLLLDNGKLVKTVGFRNPKYVGDPINAVRIFNEREVDELVVLDISATRKKQDPPFAQIEDLASECFMPFGYGGGIRTLDQIERILRLGAEKVCINSEAAINPQFVTQAAERFGTQSIVVSMDVRRSRWRGYQVYSHGGRRSSRMSAIDYAKRVEELGAGEILLNSIDRDGGMAGYDLELIKSVADAVRIPVVASGGAGTLDDVAAAIQEAGASAACAGSLFVFHGKHRAVLISFPGQAELESLLA